MSFNYTFLEQILFPNTTLKHQVLSEVLTNKTIVITGSTFGIGEELTYISLNYLANVKLILALMLQTEFFGAIIY